MTVRRLLFVLIDDCFALYFFIPTATANETISNREENNLHDCYAEHQRSTEDLIGQRVWSFDLISCDTLWSINSIAERDQPKPTRYRAFPQCTEVGRAFLNHFQKIFLNQVFIKIKIPRKLKILLKVWCHYIVLGLIFSHMVNFKHHFGIY